MKFWCVERACEGDTITEILLPLDVHILAYVKRFFVLMEALRSLCVVDEQRKTLYKQNKTLFQCSSHEFH